MIDEPSPRAVSSELNEILGKQFAVLDDGFVRVIDYMGNDAAVVQAARISYGAGTKRVSDDRLLIRYLLRHRHTTPFEMCEIKLHLRVPMDAWRQWIRHRTANVNEYSTRYSEAIDAAQRTPTTAWRFQSDANRQGSGDFVDELVGTSLSEREQEIQNLARSIYEERLKAGVAKEQARKDLPISTYTEAYWKIDLHNLLHFLSLRMDLHAQFEIRSYAQLIAKEIVSKWCPVTWEAFEDYRLTSLSISGHEVEIVKCLNTGNIVGALTIARKHGWVDSENVRMKRNREREEFEAKLGKLGMEIPW